MDVRVAGGVAVIAFLAACGDNHERPPDATGDAQPIDAAPATLFPVAPTASDFMWSSVQERFRRSDGTTCTGRITLAVNDRAVCYSGPGGELRCAGAIYTHDYGSSFVAVGQTGVDAIALSPTFNSVDGNNICIHKTDHTVWCMGSNTLYGELGTGDTAATASFVQWPVPDLVRITGWTDTMCALDGAGQVWCAGYNHTPAPTKVSDGGHRSMFLDSSGTLKIDDPAVFRASDGYLCQVKADGLHCLAPMVQMLSGTAGEVVDGTVIQAPGGLAMGNPPACALDTNGVVRCAVSGLSAQVFANAGPILALSGSFYGENLCAVANDGSLWCKGANMHGELGIGTTSPLTIETRVLPAGTFDLACQ